VEWLRVKYNIWIIVTFRKEGYGCIVDDLNLLNDKGYPISFLFKPIAVNSPQKAYSAAFDYIFNTLIKEEEIK